MSNNIGKKTLSPGIKIALIIGAVVVICILLAAAAAIIGGVLFLRPVKQVSVQQPAEHNNPYVAEQPDADEILPTPTAACIQNTIKVGDRLYLVEMIPTEEENTIPEIPKTSGVAYWVEGTTVHFVLGLANLPENFTLADTIKQGDAVIFTWADCSELDYVVTEVARGPLPEADALFDQSEGNLSLFIAAGENSLLIHAVPPEALIPSTPTAEEEAGIQVEVNLLDTIITEDKSSLTFALEVINIGTDSIEIDADSLLLRQAEGDALAPMGSDPALPVMIQPGASLRMNIVFPYPQSQSVVFQLFDFEAEYFFP